MKLESISNNTIELPMSVFKRNLNSIMKRFADKRNPLDAVIITHNKQEILVAISACKAKELGIEVE